MHIFHIIHIIHELQGAATQSCCDIPGEIIMTLTCSWCYFVGLLLAGCCLARGDQRENAEHQAEDKV